MTPLSGLVVVALEQAVAAPFATRQLADLGARVIKIERPGVGDFARRYDETVHGQASHFVWLNRGKESVSLDLKSDDGRATIQTLVSRADVFIQNLAPGAAERLGLSADALREENPGLVHVSISGYGDGGPYSTKKAYDLLVQCEAGLVSITGTPDEPSKVGISIADIASGMYAYTGILTAIIQRQQTGTGVTIEVSMLEALSEWMGYPLNYAMYGGEAPPRTGARHASIYPYGPFTCGDGNLVFLGLQNEREWAVFCERILEKVELTQDQRFSRNSLRVEHSDALRSEIERAFVGSAAEEIAAKLESAGIANAVLRDMHGLADHPHLEARDRWRTYDSPRGQLRGLIPPVTFAGSEPLMGAIPDIGEHTDTVLAEFGMPRSSGAS
ncbi:MULTISPECIES: CaiB/BaiF CoA transferase family protein [Prauserella salsuginis group]|uniref:CaiB/BaiF CoA transferase family protein n=1 Tax=Prauserella salsuginis TaxID=387889 RepID=A0ABW6G0U4_9PSEU|nr:MULTISPECIES: CaiB/BaiF CoA-transferase family protein [Prauserella salsuginis group]MCR3721977.1 Crotonobetainyl-CoA:carnitine CoA-transferase CaiB [Prauserella flava]MCR3735983.1 Crotonobetainyl-CoA:carnitine CoA-transferase CaiB [Prauserella salsuginis]